MLDSAHQTSFWRRVDTMRNVLLGILLAGAIGVYIVPTAQSYYVASLPADRWMEIKSITIEDTAVGVPPVAHVEVAIHRPFPADWSVDINREINGIITTLCGRSGAGQVGAGAQMPELGNMAWWIGPAKDAACPEAAPGDYRMVVTVTLFPLSTHPKLVRSNSGLFKVAAR